MAAFFVLHVAVTWFLTGLIWIVQVVHYPLMAAVGPAEHVRYHGRHVARITWVVAPTMLLEAATAAMLIVARPSFVSASEAMVGFALVAATWLSTALLSVPAHHQLSRRFDGAVHARLVWTNWPRTVLWSARAMLTGGWVMRGLGSL